MPDDGGLVDLVPRIATTSDQRRRLLVDNPARLCWLTRPALSSH
jgi:2-pyrone-4,6-dicarboxylate lactonase